MIRVAEGTALSVTIEKVVEGRTDKGCYWKQITVRDSLGNEEILTDFHIIGTFKEGDPGKLRYRGFGGLAGQGMALFLSHN